ncbi:MAG: glycosyltransferase [Alphaproteobacteria bacterium]|nr:glycosyltransferase [Alphaproteobacteria bacterium]
MAKAPRIGRAKRRLARRIGAVAAWAFYRRTLFAVARRLRDPRWTCWLAVTPDVSGLTSRQWPARWWIVAQGGGDLGARMLRPMRLLPPGPVVVIGSDIPDIRPDHIAAAFMALGENDWVFGPAVDGGYWLVGAKRRPRLFDPFRNARWSSEHALADTLANLPDGTTVGFVETLGDVD